MHIFHPVYFNPNIHLCFCTICVFLGCVSTLPPHTKDSTHPITTPGIICLQFSNIPLFHVIKHVSLSLPFKISKIDKTTNCNWYSTYSTTLQVFKLKGFLLNKSTQLKKVYSQQFHPVRQKPLRGLPILSLNAFLRHPVNDLLSEI